MSSSAGRYAGALAAAAVVALAIAVSSPLATTVIGLIGLGILHNVLELRYVLGRFGDLLTGTVGLLLARLFARVSVPLALAGAVGVNLLTHPILYAASAGFSSSPQLLAAEALVALVAVSYTHLTLPTKRMCRSRWSPYH